MFPRTVIVLCIDAEVPSMYEKNSIKAPLSMDQYNFEMDHKDEIKKKL